MLSLSLADVNCLVIRMCDICHKDVRQMPKTFATIVTQPFDICRTTVRHMPKHPRSEFPGQTHQNDCSHKARFSQRECEVVTTFLSRCCVPAAPFLDRAGMSGVFLLTNGNHCFHLFWYYGCIIPPMLPLSSSKSCFAPDFTLSPLKLS